MDQITTKPVSFPSAPPLDRASPDGSFVKDALYLAVREAQRGEPALARNQLKTALVQLDKVGDPTERAYWQGQFDMTAAYVEALAADAEARKTAALQADAVYVRGQKLRPDELQELVSDNVDTQNALDDQAAGRNPNLRYGASTVTKAAGNASKFVAETAAGLGGALLGPWKWALAIGAVVVVVVGVGYVFMSYRTASAVGSAA